MARKSDNQLPIVPPLATIEGQREPARTGRLNITGERLRFYDPVTLLLVHEMSFKPGCLEISFENRGERASNGRIEGIMAGFFTIKRDGITEEQPFIASGWTLGFESVGKGNPGKRNRDVALALAVGFEEYRRRISGASTALIEIFEELCRDVNWNLHDADTMKKAYQRGNKLLRAACFTVVARTPQADDVVSTFDVWALVKARGSFTSESEKDWCYVGFPWIWRRGLYAPELTDPIRPVTLRAVDGFGYGGEYENGQG